MPKMQVRTDDIRASTKHENPSFLYEEQYGSEEVASELLSLLESKTLDTNCKLFTPLGILAIYV